MSIMSSSSTSRSDDFEDLCNNSPPDLDQNNLPKHKKTAYRCGATNCGKMFVGEEFLRTHIERIHLKNYLPETNTTTDTDDEGDGNEVEHKRDEEEEDLEEEFNDLEVFFQKEEIDLANTCKDTAENESKAARGKGVGKTNSPKLAAESLKILCDKNGCDKSFTGKSRR